MHLAETSLIKKYENDIGTSIVNVGGDINHDTHWLPYLDDQIKDQLVGGEYAEDLIEKILDERGLTEEAVDAWNQELVEAVRYTLQNKTPEEKSQARSNINAQETLVSGVNIKTINNSSILGSGDIEIEDEPEIFIIEYGVTPVSDVADAYDAGKTIYCKVLKNDIPNDWPSKTYIPSDGYELVPLNYLGESKSWFSCVKIFVSNNQVYSLYCGVTGSWFVGVNNYPYELSSNKATDLTSPNNTKYPTTKAVTDALVTKANADLVPAQASPENQLADKAFVNSTVQTNTANFRGNWSSLSDIPANPNLYPVDYAGNRTPTVNDYLVVQDITRYVQEWVTNLYYSTGDIVMYNYELFYCIQTIEYSDIEPALDTTHWKKWFSTDEMNFSGTWRFKYTGEWGRDNIFGWHPEYQVNETPLTAAQLAALNSGITSEKVQKLDNLPSEIPTEIFWATYESTTTAELLDAINANKEILVKTPGGTVLHYVKQDTNYIYFSSIYGNGSNWIIFTKSSSNWLNGTWNLEKIDNKRSSWSTTPNNTNYPTEKLVYDSLATKQDLLVWEE